MTDFGDMIKAYRDHRGLTQAELGEMVGVSHTYIYNLEKGKNLVPSPDVLASFARVFGVHKTVLLRAIGYLDDQDMRSNERVTQFTSDQEIADLRHEIAESEELRQAIADVIGRELLRRRR